MITVNDVRDGVIRTLDTAFSDIPIQGENISQGLQEPYFYVKLLSMGQAREVNRRYLRAHLFDIHYFAGTNRERHAMAEQLYDILRRINVGTGSAGGRGLRHEIVDDILHFFVSYDFHVIDDEPVAPLMQELEQEGGIKP